MKIHLRRLLPGDSKLLQSWRNDPEAVAQSLSQRPVSDTEHIHWFSKVLDSNTSLVFIGEARDSESNLPVGMCRFDKSADQTLLVSINVDPAFRGQGLSKQLLLTGIQAVYSTWPDFTTVRAEVRQENLPSMRLFESAGFEHIDSEEGVSRYQKQLRV